MISSICLFPPAEPHSSASSLPDLRIGRLLVRSMARSVFFPRINDNHCNRIHSSLTSVCCFDNGYVGKQPVALKEYCMVSHTLKELQESMDRCSGHRDLTEIVLKTVLNNIHTINQSVNPFPQFFLPFQMEITFYHIFFALCKCFQFGQFSNFVFL